jgi:hypothetical protein
VTDLVQALEVVRSLWPQTQRWPEDTWRAWAAALADLTPDQLADGIRRSCRVDEWPTVAGLRRAALADRLAPPAAVALADPSAHPIAEAVARQCSHWSGVFGEGSVLDEVAFMARYRAAAAEHDRRLLAGETSTEAVGALAPATQEDL